MDHLPFWHWPPTAAGTGLGQGTYDIIEYVGTLNPSQFTGPYNHMVRVFFLLISRPASTPSSHPLVFDAQDPDFLETLFPLTMSAIDSRTEFTFWSLWSAPLIVATDLRNLSEQTPTQDGPSLSSSSTYP